jgi:hypothetical protein
MSASSSTQWFWSDWLGDQAVRRLSLPERGLWIDLLALMAAAQPVGYLCDDKGRPLALDEIARVTNAASVEEVANLVSGILDKGAASRDRTGRLYNRRMVKEAANAAKKRRNGQLGGAATRLKWQQFQTLPHQNAWHVPGAAMSTLTYKKESTSSFPLPREEKNKGPDPPARSLATALPTGALTRSPSNEQAEAGIRDKPVWAVTRDELAATYAAKPNGKDHE